MLKGSFFPEKENVTFLEDNILIVHNVMHSSSQTNPIKKYTLFKLFQLLDQTPFSTTIVYDGNAQLEFLYRLVELCSKRENMEKFELILSTQTNIAEHFFKDILPKCNVFHLRMPHSDITNKVYGNTLYLERFEYIDRKKPDIILQIDTKGLF